MLIHNPNCRLWKKGPHPAANDASQGLAKLRKRLPDWISWPLGMCRRIPSWSPHSGVGGEPVSSGKNRNEIAITADLPTITTRGPSLEYGNRNKKFKTCILLIRLYILLAPYLRKTIPCAHHVRSKEHYLRQQLWKLLWSISSLARLLT